MTEQVETHITDGVAHVAVTPRGRPVLDQALAQSLIARFDALRDNTDVRAVVLYATKGDFPGGVDDLPGDVLAHLCAVIETFPAPVIMMLSGAVIGSAAELALAAHYRPATPDARMGFPHVRLGVIPASGATQRLPRLTNASLALDMFLSGRLVPLHKGTAKALVDDTIDAATPDAAQQVAKSLIENGKPPRPTRDIRTGFADAAAYQSAIEHYRTRNANNREDAPDRIIEAVEAAILLPFDAGLAFETAASEDERNSPQSRALRWAFDSEQRAASATRRANLPALDSIAVLGGGSVAVQIVICALDAGLRVHWGARKPELLRDGVGRVRSTLEAAVKQGRLSPVKAAQCLDALRTGESAAMLDGADMVLRAARGQRGIKPGEDIAVAHCIPGEEARMALRFAAPAASMRLAEVVIGPQAKDTDLPMALALCRRLRKVAVLEEGSQGSVYDHLTAAMMRAADALVDLGQSPFVIDAALQNWGMAVPPYQWADAQGLDSIVGHERAGGGQNWAGTMVRLGRGGKQDRLGFYSYEDLSHPQSDSTVSARLDERRGPRAAIPADQIARLVLAAMANEGARLLRDGLVRHAADVDVVSVLSGLVPRWRGGILHSVGDMGLLTVVNAMKTLGHPDTAFWTPEPVFDDLIKNGLGFDAL